MQPFVAKQKIRKRRDYPTLTLQLNRSFAIYPIVAKRERVYNKMWLRVLVDQIAGLKKCLPRGDLPLLTASIGLLLFILVLTFGFNIDLFFIGNRKIEMPRSMTPLLTTVVPQNTTVDKHYLPLKIMEYQVSPGDTISDLAENFHLRMGTILSFNNIDNVRRLRIGEVLEIPDRNGLLTSVGVGETLEQIALQYGITVNSILDANNLIDNNIQVGQQLFLPNVSMSNRELKLAIGEYFHSPTTGRLSSGFGLRKDPFTGLLQHHNGIDIANKTGTNIFAVREGEISFVGWRPKSYGKFLIIRHDREFQTLYAHVDKILVKSGDYVRSGQQIATMGNNGKSTGPHLHFSIMRHGKFVNPLGYIDR